MSAHPHPKLAAIDDALTTLEPALEAFCQAHGFALTRSHGGSLNIPRRWLHRHSGPLLHEVGLVISLDMAERLERGFYPGIPCTLYISAFDREKQQHYHTAITEAQPFSLLIDNLPRHLADALTRLNACTTDFIVRHGTPSWPTEATTG